MRLLRDPDHVNALGSVPRDVGSENERPTRWAVDELHQMNSPAADAELDRFAEEPHGCWRVPLGGRNGSL